MSEILTPDAIIAALNLQPHPEGGLFAETFRDSDTVNGRSVGTAIYYLLRAGEISHWHRVDAAEIWHHYAGAALRLQIADPALTVQDHVLGNNLLAGEQPQIVVPARQWQSAQSLGDWTLVGCTVSPGFEFSGFEMAPVGWRPSAR